MDDVVGIRIVDAKRGEVGLLSWGRIHGALDSGPLLERIGTLLPSMGFRDVTELSLCGELAELRDFQYFYEGIVSFSAAYAERKRSLNELHAELLDDVTLRKSFFLLGHRRS
jgi:hypothetical protein